MDFSGVLASIFNIIAQTTNESSGVLNWLTTKFEAGGGFMCPILICLILGLAFCFERLWTLTRSKTNTKKFIIQVKRALDDGGIEQAKEVCANTRGPVASVFHAGLLRADEGLEAAEKAITAYGSIEMSFLERGLVWLSLFINLAPMFGFLGTVVGMVGAFDAIEAAGDISPSLVAGGIKVALLTTVGGLISAIILQVGYNYCVSKIDRLVSDMEESSIALIDALALHQLGK
jgi:biopolymer transport protein ExbB